MNIHEYQGKQLLAEYGVAVPRGLVAFSTDDAENAAKSSPGSKIRTGTMPVAKSETPSKAEIAAKYA